MTRKTKRTESKMLEEIRRWRKEAYEEHQGMSEEERAERFRKLADRFGLEIAEPPRPRRR